MDLTFERGDGDSPRGHAVLYYRDSAKPESVAATYMVVLPVSVDFAKYMPPFLAGQVPNLGDDAITAFAFPPSPEPAESYDAIVAMAESRDDDLIFGGERRLSDVMGLLASVSEITEEYAGRYDALRAKPEIDGETAEKIPDADLRSGDSGVDDVVYGMMSDADRLGELTKLVGRLRYATEGGDTATADEAAANVRALGRHMPSNRRIDRLLDAAVSPSANGAKLAQLYLERAYSLLREDYLRVKAIDDEITATESDVSGSA